MKIKFANKDGRLFASPKSQRHGKTGFVKEALPSLMIFVAMSPMASGLTTEWIGTTSGNMSGTATNWDSGVPTSSDIARWSAASYTTAPSANANMTIGQLLFDAGNTNGVTFGAGTSTLTLNGISGVGIQLNSGSGAVNTSLTKFSLGADQTWLNNSANTFTVGGTITNASTTIARTLTLDGTGSTILNGIISNNTATTTITKAGSGTLTLGAANTFTGGLRIQNGTVRLTNATGAGAGLVTIGSDGNSGVLDLNGASRTIISLATAGIAANQKITNTAAAAATVNYTGATTSTFGGVIENGSGGSTTAVTVNNASANLTLSGENTYTGLTTITAGTLKIGATNAINSGNALTNIAAGTFDLNGFDQTLGTLINHGTITNSSGATKTLTFGSASVSSGNATGSFTGAMDVIYNASNTATASMAGSWSNTGNITVNANGTSTITFSGASINNTGTFTNSGSGVGPLVVSGNLGPNVGLITQNSATSALTLSGTNTNAAGVNLTAGTLTLGSTTALGATASTLTIAGGTTLNSNVANLVLANNNAINLNGSFTFTGTQSLNVGTGAVTLAGPLTLTTSTAANTLALGGNISGGTIFDITKAGAGTLLYTGDIAALTSDRTANITAGTLAITSNITGGHGITINGAGTLAFRGATTNAAASAITANAGSALTLDSSADGTVGTTRAASVNLKGASLNVLGNTTANSNDTINGALTVGAPTTWGGAGANTVTLTAQSGANTRLTVDSLVRANDGAVFFRGTNLGANTIASNTAGTTNIAFTGTAPALIGGGGAAGSKNISILPWAVGLNTAAVIPVPEIGFVTYDANGIRVLAADEYDTTVPATASTNNVRLNAATTVTANGATTVNSLFINNHSASTTALAGTGALTVTSGAIYADLSLGGNNTATTISKQVDFGNVRGLIGTMGTSQSKTLAFTGGISGSAGIMVYDTGTASSNQAGVNIGAATTYTGDTIVNGTLRAGHLNALPNFSNAGRTGDVYVNGTFAVHVSSNGTVQINGLSGDGRVTKVFTGATTLVVGDNNATSNFSGVIEQTGDLFLRKIGTGTLTLGGTASTYVGSTSVQNGTLSAVTLNSVNAGTPLLASSSLGRPTTEANGTIALGATTTTGTLRVTGTGETTDRVINLAGTTGGGGIEQAGTGLLKFTSNFTALGAGSKTLTLSGSTAGMGEIAGAIVNNSGTNVTSLTKSGTGTWILSGNSTYSGATSVQNGTLSAVTLNSVAAPNASSSLGRATTVTAGTIALGASTTTGTLRVTGTGETTDRVINLAGTTGGGGIEQAGTGLLKFTSNFTATGVGAKTLALSGSTDGMGEIAGAIVDNTSTNKTSVTKNGTGTWTLSGDSSYTGNTTVSAGKLIVNGNISTSLLTSVNSGATLGGNGTFGAASISGILAPGNSIGTITATGNVTWEGAATVGSSTAWQFELGLGNMSDRLEIVGIGSNFIKGSGSIFSFDFLGSAHTGTFTLVDWSDASNTNFEIDDFSYTNLGGGNTGTFSFSGSQLNFTVIPEPNAALLIGAFGVIALLRRRRA
jgi:fibronectin-binding autotransporter adhesin